MANRLRKKVAPWDRVGHLEFVPIYRIENVTTGYVLGTYSAEDEAAALDAMARDAGYADFDDSSAVTGADPSEIVAREVGVSR